MPYVSDAQRKFFHTAAAKAKGITPAVVNEFDKASKGMNLPKKAHKYPNLPAHIHRVTEKP